MTLSSAIRAGQAAAERLMVDTVTVERVSRVGVEDGLGGIEYPRVAVYEGKAKVQTYEPYEQTPKSGGHTYVVQRYSVHVPYDQGPFEIGDIVTIKAAGFAAHAVGTQYRIAGLHEKSIQTAQRFLVDEVVG